MPLCVGTSKDTYVCMCVCMQLGAYLNSENMKRKYFHPLLLSISTAWRQELTLSLSEGLYLVLLCCPRQSAIIPILSSLRTDRSCCGFSSLPAIIPFLSLCMCFLTAPSPQFPPCTSYGHPPHITGHAGCDCTALLAPAAVHWQVWGSAKAT